MSETSELGLPYLAAGQAQKHVTLNESLRKLDALVQVALQDRHLATPPASPTEGVRYWVPSGAGGIWASHSGKIAAFQDGVWNYFVPRAGWLAYLIDEEALAVWSGVDWVIITSGGAGITSVNPIDRIGIETTADNTNRLAVSSAASLFTHAGQGHQLKINKALASHTASLLFQTSYSGRAEFGLAGDDSFRIKVSADGNSWSEALVVDPNTGAVSLPNTTLSGGGGGVSDHGALTGLSDDDHPHYLNNARGDVRYAAAAHHHNASYEPIGAANAALSGHSAAPDPHPQYLTNAEGDARYLQSVNSTPLVGVNATADTVNRLTVSSAASQFNHAGSDHRLKVNKAGAADTASVLFQNSGLGHGEIGLAGNDDLRLKVSPDGAQWFDALVVDRNTGSVTLPNTSQSGGGGGGGVVAQIKVGTLTTGFTMIGTTAVPTGLRATIRPASLSSTILVRLSVLVGGRLWYAAPSLTVWRNGSRVWPQGNAPYLRQAIMAGSDTNSSKMNFSVPIEFLDQPGATSDQTYELYLHSDSAIYNVHINLRESDLALRGESSIVLTELLS